MKIGILTFHFPYNCGAFLQCAALKTFLENNGNQVEIINYRPWYHQNVYAVYKNPWQTAKEKFRKKNNGDFFLKRLARSAYNFCKVIKSWVFHKEKARQNSLFEPMQKKYLNETKVYRSLKKLKKNPPECDVYICGSDQLWNTVLTDGKADMAYFLDFGDNVRKMSYAVGVYFKDEPENAHMLSKFLEKFENISLREMTYANEIAKLVKDESKIRQDADPTLLLKAEDYEKFICKETLENDPFIVTYVMPDDSRKLIFEAAYELGRKKKLKVIDICGNPTAFNKKAKDGRMTGPAEFLWYLKNAQYVFTNSFHGTAFSIIYKKKFVAMPHYETGYRVKNLLAITGLEDRCTYNVNDAIKLADVKIDYEKASDNLETEVKKSKEYLTSI